MITRISSNESAEFQTYLADFINNLGESANSFRYFNKRKFDVLQNHLVTYIYLDEQKPIGYGHLDQENETVWLGIALLPEYQGIGLGEKIMNELIDVGKRKGVSQICLIVDSDNLRAIQLYEKLNFYCENNSGGLSPIKFKLNLQ